MAIWGPVGSIPAPAGTALVSASSATSAPIATPVLRQVVGAAIYLPLLSQRGRSGSVNSSRRHFLRRGRERFLAASCQRPSKEGRRPCRGQRPRLSESVFVSRSVSRTAEIEYVETHVRST